MSATTQKGNVLPLLLRAAYPQHTVKRAAIAADVPTETAKKWVQGRANPSASILLRMAARCDALAAVLEGYLHDRRNPSPANQVLPMARECAAADRGVAE